MDGFSKKRVLVAITICVSWLQQQGLAEAPNAASEAASNAAATKPVVFVTEDNSLLTPPSSLHDPAIEALAQEVDRTAEEVQAALSSSSDQKTVKLRKPIVRRKRRLQDKKPEIDSESSSSEQEPADPSSLSSSAAEVVEKKLEAVPNIPSDQKQVGGTPSWSAREGREGIEVGDLFTSSAAPAEEKKVEQVKDAAEETKPVEKVAETVGEEQEVLKEAQAEEEVVGEKVEAVADEEKLEESLKKEVKEEAVEKKEVVKEDAVEKKEVVKEEAVQKKEVVKEEAVQKKEVVKEEAIEKKKGLNKEEAVKEKKGLNKEEEVKEVKEKKAEQVEVPAAKEEGVDVLAMEDNFVDVPSAVLEVVENIANAPEKIEVAEESLGETSNAVKDVKGKKVEEVVVEKETKKEVEGKKVVEGNVKSLRSAVKVDASPEAVSAAEGETIVKKQKLRRLEHRSNEGAGNFNVHINPLGLLTSGSSLFSTSDNRRSSVDSRSHSHSEEETPFSTPFSSQHYPYRPSFSRSSESDLSTEEENVYIVHSHHSDRSSESSSSEEEENAVDRMEQAFLFSNGRRAEACFECDVDYFGYDVKKMENGVKDLAECQKFCQEHALCDFFTFVEQWGGCYLKHSRMGKKEEREKVLVSGKKFCADTRRSIDCHGKKIRW